MIRLEQKRLSLVGRHERSRYRFFVRASLLVASCQLPYAETRPPTRASKAANAVTIHAHLSEVSTSSDRDDADRRLSVLLRLQGLRRTAEASLWRLLCFLLLRFFAVSANPTEWKRRMLWLVEQPQASHWSGVRERPHARSTSLLFACYRARFNCNRPVTLAASSLRSLYRFVRYADTSRVSSVSFTSSSITSTTRS